VRVGLLPGSITVAGTAHEGLQSGFFLPGFAIFGAVACLFRTRPFERGELEAGVKVNHLSYIGDAMSASIPTSAPALSPATGNNLTSRTAGCRLLTRIIEVAAYG
jgi:hypothetical protein